MQIQKLEKDKFPSALLEIPDPPQNLWIMGNLPEPIEDFKYLTVVGSRKNTSYGKDVCEKIISGLRGYPIIIVSGFALGIDTIAHKSALDAGLSTIAFPGSGLSEKTIYPKANFNLIDKIIKGKGCLLSEFEPNFQATIWSFPQRNRLMAGFSQATLVIEAKERSGTLITARLALEYNRDLLTVPGSIFLPSHKGTNKLIRQGATPITSSEDILEALGFERPKDTERQIKLITNLSIEEMNVVELLQEPLSRDELIRAMNMNISKANTILSAMEIKEIIREEMGEIQLCQIC